MDMKNLIGKKVIIRGDRSGVFYGILTSKDGREVELHDCRRLWYWSGAASLHQLANEGVKNPSDCKFTITIPSIVILDAIEIIECSKDAIRIIDEVPVWRI